MKTRFNLLSNIFSSAFPYFIIFLLLCFFPSKIIYAQMRIAKNMFKGKPRIVMLKKVTNIPKSSNSKTLAVRPILFNIGKAQLKQLKSKMIMPGAMGGRPVRDRSQKSLLNKTLAPISNTGFGGIIQGDPGTGWIPPDPILAAGRNEIVEVVNDAMAVFDTLGNPIYYNDLVQDFFKFRDSLGGIFDPKVEYDPQSGRFIFLCLYANDIDKTSYYLLAVSSDSVDPGGSWWIYTFDATNDGTNPSPYMADFPGLGFDSTSIYITSNQYDFDFGNFQYAKLVIVDKSSIYAGSGPLSYNTFYGMTNQDGSTAFTIKPAATLSSSSKEYLLNTNPDGANYVTAWEVSYDINGKPSLTRAGTISIGSYTMPPDAAQLGTTSLISTGDCRTQEVVWKDDELYSAFTQGYNWASGPVAAIRLLKINTNSWVADRNVTYGSDGVSYFYPAVTPNNLDQTFLVFNSSASYKDVDIRSAAEIWNDSSSVLINQSYSNYEEPRWGDYNGISLSPSGTIWAVGEIAVNPTTWGTTIGSLAGAFGPTITDMDVYDSVADFVGVRVGTSATIKFFIRNDNISNSSLAGTASVMNSKFSILYGSSFNIQPGKTTEIVIQYNAINPGFVMDTLIITNNSSNYSNQLKVPIIAYSLEPSSKPKRIKLDLADDYYGQLDSLYFASFINLLRTQGNIVVDDDSTFDLRGFDYFISVTPYRDYTPAETEALQKFVKEGGGLIILPYSYYNSGSQFQNDLLESQGWSTGISINNQLVVDTTEEIENNYSWINISDFPHSADTIVSTIDTLGAFNSVSLTVAAPAESLAVTSPYAYDFFLKVHSPNTIKPSEKPILAKGDNQILKVSNAGTIPIIAKVDLGSGQIIVLGNEDMLSESYYSPAFYTYPPYYFPGIRYGKNRILALNLFDTQVGPPVVKILSVKDVPNDAGKQVRIIWKNEFTEGPTPITNYAVWRYDSTWTYITQVPANTDSIYSAIIATLADSSANGNNYSLFRITAYTQDNLKIFNSNIDSGYSVNNLEITSVPSPNITSINDVPNDQGGKVYLNWKLNSSPVLAGVTNFAVWRKDSIWTFVSNVTATSDTSYAFIAPTIFDSTISFGMHYSIFKVSAHSSNPAIYAESLPDSGYSVDNLVPHIPSNLAINQADSGSIVLHWNAVSDKDIQYYKVYRSSNSVFILDSTTLIGMASDTLYKDSGVHVGSKYYYKILAIDFSGNQSLPSNEVSLVVTSINEKISSLPAIFKLAQNYPNPFNPSTIISYDLPKSTHVVINIYDVLGNKVRVLEDDYKHAGSYSITFEASNLSSGVYFYKLTAGNFIAIKKLILEK